MKDSGSLLALLGIIGLIMLFILAQFTNKPKSNINDEVHVEYVKDKGNCFAILEFRTLVEIEKVPCKSYEKENR